MISKITFTSCISLVTLIPGLVLLIIGLVLYQRGCDEVTCTYLQDSIIDKCVVNYNEDSCVVNQKDCPFIGNFTCYIDKNSECPVNICDVDRYIVLVAFGSLLLLISLSLLVAILFMSF